LLPWRKPITIRASLLRSFVILILVSSLSVLILMSIRAYRTERELSAKLINNGSQLAAQELDRFFQPANQGALIAAFWGRSGKLNLDEVVAGTPGQVTETQRQAATNLNTLLLPLLLQLPEISSVQVANARGDGFLILQLPSGHIRNRVVSREKWGSQTLWFNANKEGLLTSFERQTLDYDPRKRAWYVGLEEQPYGEVHWTEPYVFFTTKDLGITASIKFENADLTYVIAYDVLLTAVTDFTQADPQQLSKHSQMAIFTDKWQAIGLPRHARFSTLDTIRQAFLCHVDKLGTPEFTAAVTTARKNKAVLRSLKETQKAIFPFTCRGEKWWAGVSAYPLGKARHLWTVMLVPNRDLLEGISQQRVYLLIATIVALAAALLYSFLLARMYSLPLEALAAQSRRISDLDFVADEKIEARLQEFTQLKEAQEQSLAALQSFARYVPLEVVKKLVAKGEVAKIGGRLEVLTVLFTDIVGFTSISESMDPEALTRHLAEYFQAMIDILQECSATVDKIVGDGIVAFWGAPVRIDNQAAQAVRAVLGCQSALQALNQDWLTEGKPAFPTRFGLARGPVVVGNIGSSNRLSYTVLGDTVNLASRLEGLNKLYGTTIIVDESLYQDCLDQFEWRCLDRLVVFGKTQPTEIYEVLGEAGQVPDRILAAARRYESAWEHYQSGDFHQALAGLAGFETEFGEDTAVRRLRQICEEYRLNPPKNWNGIAKVHQK
jgi:adenylate cyclase